MNKENITIAIFFLMLLTMVDVFMADSIVKSIINNIGG